MGERKTMLRFFTIADYMEEEKWLRETHASGWKLVKMVPPCFFIFEACEPEDVIYRLDYKNNLQDDEYMQMVKDFGWEYCAKCVGWLYFRKSAAAALSEGDENIFSDNASRLEMVEHIIKTRLLPLLLIFLSAVVPNVVRSVSYGMGIGLCVFCCLMFLVYVYLLIHCGLKLKKIKRELS